MIVSKIHRVIYVGLQKKLDDKSAILLVAREMHQRDEFRPLMRAYGSERIKALAEGQKVIKTKLVQHHVFFFIINVSVNSSCSSVVHYSAYSAAYK